MNFLFRSALRWVCRPESAAVLPRKVCFNSCFTKSNFGGSWSGPSAVLLIVRV